MATVQRINHVAIVVDDIDAALGFWRDGLGLQVTHVEDVPSQESIVAFLPTGDSEVELVKPTSPDSSVARFLGHRGPGIHHICFEVDDLFGYIDRLQELGVRLVNNEPEVGTGGKLIAFIHPESTHGVLVELYQLTRHEPEIRLERARNLADRAMGQGQVMAAGVLAFLRALRAESDGKGAGRLEG
ncbi:MAG: methylmalonyl-CoA epimerase [Chloroflexi bacterium RBG_19FT_COMBO_62_14]|nr:MAG: methylmalonyl-CoA epimerase [Chloroflexi bacterium RBG_19FT_COMBO_62_14]